MRFFVLDEDIVWNSGADVDWEDEEYPWFSIEGGYWFISEGVGWDGASFVPDGPEDPSKKGFPITWLATLIHDIGYYFLRLGNFPYERKQIDLYFYNLLKESGFKASFLYYLGVRLFGSTFIRLAKFIRSKFHTEKRHLVYIPRFENIKKSDFVVAMKAKDGIIDHKELK